MAGLRERLFPPPTPPAATRPGALAVTLRPDAAPELIDGWRVSVHPGFVEMRREADGRYLNTTGEPWMAADTLTYRALETAAGNDIEVARGTAAKAVATERWRIYRQMAEALVSRDRAALLTEEV
jgi:hypothetical protein